MPYDPLAGYFLNENEECMKFKIGDIVYTRKRGKGRIIGNVYPPDEHRVAVDFFDDTSLFLRWFTDIKYPKKSNLLTENEYKEATKPAYNVKSICAVFDNAKIKEAMKKFAEEVDAEVLKELERQRKNEIKVDAAVLYRGKKWHITEIKTEEISCDGMPPKVVSEHFTIRRVDDMGTYKAVVSREDISLWKEPKFKAGDVVFYNGEKWEVVYGYTYSKDFDYCISRGLDHLSVKESELRLWKETKITHDDRMERCSMTYAASDFKSLKYVGTHLNGFDIFSQDAGNGKVVVWYGIKGDDIQ